MNHKSLNTETFFNFEPFSCFSRVYRKGLTVQWIQMQFFPYCHEYQCRHLYAVIFSKHSLDLKRKWNHQIICNFFQLKLHCFHSFIFIHSFNLVGLHSVAGFFPVCLEHLLVHHDQLKFQWPFPVQKLPPFEVDQKKVMIVFKIHLNW